MRGYTVIENEAAYNAAIKRNIIANANKTFHANFERAEDVEVFLKRFAITDDYGRVVNFKDGFMGSMAAAIHNYGKLTQKQYDSVVRIMDEQAAKREAYIAAVEAQKALRSHVGIANERIEFKLHVDKIVEVEVQKFSYYDSPIMRIYLMRDEAGNRVVYKTKTNWHMTDVDGIAMFVKEKSDITIKATVKDHAEYKGEKQTIIARAKVLGMEYKKGNLKEPFDTQK